MEGFKKKDEVRSSGTGSISYSWIISLPCQSEAEATLLPKVRQSIAVLLGIR